MILQNASIKKKMHAIILGTAAAVLLLSFVLFMLVEINSEREYAHAHIQALATVLGDNSRAAILFRDKKQQQTFWPHSLRKRIFCGQLSF